MKADVDQLKELELKIAELELIKRYLESILTHIGQAILFIDLDGRITTYNPTAEKLLGYAKEEVLYRQYSDFFEDKAFGFSMRDALNRKHPTSNSFAAVINIGGKKRDLEVTATYVPKGSYEVPNELSCPLPRKLEGLILILKDVTEIHRLENRAQHGDRMKEMGRMASIMAHEIRNPLGGIKGFAVLLSRDLENQPKLKQMADYILEGVESLNGLVTQILNYSRPLEPHFEMTDLNHLLNEIVIQKKPDEALKGKIKIAFKPSAGKLIAPVDSELLKRAILNLIANAVQAMPSGGDIALQVDVEDDQALIKISDTGDGISEENMKKIFTPFFTTKPQGNGYGLAEVQKVVQCHGGHVEVVSKPGEGTEFTLKIPLRISHDY